MQFSAVSPNLAKSRPAQDGRCRAKHEAFIQGPERAVRQVDGQETSELCVARSSPDVGGRAEAKNAKWTAESQPASHGLVFSARVSYFQLSRLKRGTFAVT